MSYAELLATSLKGWRIRRCGELICAGDLVPDGPIWKPVDPSYVGYRVDGCCYRKDGSPDFVLGKRLRTKANKQNKQI